MKAKLSRVGISVPSTLLEHFDHYISNRGYSNRSKAICDLVRDKLTQEEWKLGNEEVVGAVSLVYDHHTRELAAKLTELQHQNHQYVISTTHVHIDKHNCLEIITLRGPGKAIRKLGENLIATRGVLHGKMIFSTTGKEFHNHSHED